MIRNNVIIEVSKYLKQNLPYEIKRDLKKLIPLITLASILEIISVFLLFPVLTIILQPSENSNFIIDGFNKITGITSSYGFIIISFLLILIFFSIKNLILWFSFKQTTRSIFNIATKIATNRFSTYLNQNLAEYNQNNVAFMIRNVTQIPYEFSSFVLLSIIQILNEIVLVFLLFIVLLFIQPTLLISLLAFALPVFFIYNKVFKQKFKTISKNRDHYSHLQYKNAYESLDSIIEIKTENKVSFFQNKFEDVSKHFEKTMIDTNVINSISPKITETLGILALLVITLVGFILKIDLKSLSSFVLLFSLTAFRIIPSINKITLYANYIKGSHHVLQHLNWEQTKHISPDLNPITFVSIIELKNISYRIRANSKVIFNELNLSILKGRKIGIIGESGVGKSTLLNVFLGLTPQEKGEIIIDGKNIELFPIQSWYQLISYVPQTTKLIYGSIAENIAFGVKESEIDYNKISELINLVKLNEFVNQIPGGIHGKLGENNKSISGGQAQRLGIARALYFNKQILLLDEATSALDSVTESHIVDVLTKLNGVTILFVTHKTHSLENFDEIYEVKNASLSPVKSI